MNFIQKIKFHHTTRKRQKKDLSNLTFADDFIFSSIIQEDETVCKKLLQCLLQKQINRITYHTSQKVLKHFYYSKGVRFDAFIEGDDSVYEIEMQMTNIKSITKRVLYYLIMICAEQLRANKDYSKLPKIFVIFICKHDPFGDSEPVYTVERVCKENKNTDVSNDTYEVYFNASAWDKESDVDLRAFLRYIYTNETTDAFTKELHNKVMEQIARERYKKMFGKINLWKLDARHEGYDEGYNEGISYGISQGRAESQKIIAQRDAYIAQKEEHIAELERQLAQMRTK